MKVFAQKNVYNKLTINNLWFQRYKKNSIHNWHVHGDNYTGVYYLELPKDNVSCLTEFLYPDNLEKSFSIDANEGDIIFFPSFLIHRAPSLQSKKTKTIISWNCNFNEIQSKYTYDRKNTKIKKKKKQIVQLKGD